MNELIIKELTSELNISGNQIETTLKLLEEGATIPFIARYRKEATGALDENQIKAIGDLYTYYQNLLERKEAVIRLIAEKDLLTDELKDQIMACKKLTEVEDLYRPYKEKKKTKASEAIKAGLEPLAKMIMSLPTSGSLEGMAQKFVCEAVPDTKAALEGAGYIIAEWISDNAYYRKWIRNYMFKSGVITSKIKKNANDEKKLYDMYYDFSEPVKQIKHYRVLALNRGEDEKILTVGIDVDNEAIVEYLEKKILKVSGSIGENLIKDAIKDSLKRLIMPSVEREVRSELTENAEEKAINTDRKSTRLNSSHS